MKNFSQLGLNSKIVKILENKFEKPTPVQEAAIPAILNGESIVAIANTGSGKSLAFLLPIIQDIIKTDKYYRALIITPTRELAYQINNVAEMFTKEFGIRTVLLTGGSDDKEQKRKMFESPHLIIGTLGRLRLISKNIKLFYKIKYLVLDECDKLIEKNFEKDLISVLENINEKKQILLFSATMTDKVESLSKLQIKTAKRIEINPSSDVVDELVQFYSLIPHKYKETYLYVYLLENTDKKIIVFINDCLMVQTINKMMHALDLFTHCLYGTMKQDERNCVLDNFIESKSGILLTTDVSARGIDIQNIDIVVNYDMPSHTTYIHRTGRTARAGKNGTSLSFVTQYNLESFMTIEKHLNIKMNEHEMDNDRIKTFYENAINKYKAAYREVKINNDSDDTKRRKKRRIFN